MEIGYYIVAVLLFATLGVMMLGVILMGVGGKANTRYGNRLMVARVSLQGMTLLAVALLCAGGKN